MKMGTTQWFGQRAKERVCTQRCVFAILAGLAIGVSVASAVPVLPASTPGWKYGQLNCGPYSKPPTYTYDGCKACCLTMLETGTARNADCEAFCKTVTWYLFP